MKLLTITVPCYNSKDYMRKCIESLLIGGEEVEILIVNDGSSDETESIAREYEEKYPTIVRLINQENKGHGGAVNTGMENARGLYFKVVDSDDWVNEQAYKKILEALEMLVTDATQVDVLLSNYVYEKEGAKRKRVMRYVHDFPINEIFTWKSVKRIPPTRYILMHSLIYRTELLRECGLKLPEHTFYVDNIFAYEPFIHVKTMFYLDVNFYRYYIGREDQSVNEEVMKKRIDQQLKVNNRMIDFLGEQRGLVGSQRSYILHSLGIIMTVSSIMLMNIGTDEALEKKHELWKRLKHADRLMYFRVRHGFTGMVVNLPGKSGRKVTLTSYKIVQKLYGFN